MRKRIALWITSLIGVLAASPVAEAQAQESGPDREQRPSRSSIGPSLELALLGPFIGLTEEKVLIPVVRTRDPALRGELMLGTYTDFAWGPISRPADQYGKVWIIGVRPGYRQYLPCGFFVDSSIVLGWRHEELNHHDGGTLNGFYGRLWANAGWQVDVSPRTFFNVRGGAGLILWRTDAYGSSERTWQPSADVNLGVRF
jgi:hypothetical protein